MGIFDWAGDAVKAAGHAIESGVEAVADATGSIGDALASIPVVGGLLDAIYSPLASPFKMTDNLLQGVSLDKVIMRQLEEGLNDAKAIAPYAQIVISFFPGIGPIASAAIGIAVSLANGRTIDQALLDGVESALPGGPLAKMAFDAAKSAINGDSIDQIAISALPIPDTAKKLVSAGLDVVTKLAKGNKIDDVLMAEAMKVIPEQGRIALQAAMKAVEGGKISDILMQAAQDEMKTLPGDQAKLVAQAIGIGMAFAQGQNIQNDIMNLVSKQDFVRVFEKKGTDFAAANPVIAAARNFNIPGTQAFDVATGLMQVVKLPRSVLLAARTAFQTADELKGFDIGVSTYMGAVIAKYATPDAQKDAVKLNDVLKNYVNNSNFNLATMTYTNQMATAANKVDAVKTTQALKDYVNNSANTLSAFKVGAPVPPPPPAVVAAAPTLSPDVIARIKLLPKATADTLLIIAKTNPGIAAAFAAPTDATKAAYYATMGMIKQTADNKESMAKDMIQNPNAKDGVELAVAQVTAAKETSNGTIWIGVGLGTAVLGGLYFASRK